MIALRNVSCISEIGNRRIIENVTFRFPADTTIGVLGYSGSGKSQFLRMLAGSGVSSTGSILRDGTTSWPLSVMGGFHPNLSLLQNISILNQLYDWPEKLISDRIVSFAELKIDPTQKLKTLPAQTKARISLAISLLVDFDNYVFDDITTVGGPAFKTKTEEHLLTKTRNKTCVVGSHDLQHIETVCDAACILQHGQLYYFDDVREATHVYKNSK